MHGISSFCMRDRLFRRFGFRVFRLASLKTVFDDDVTRSNRTEAIVKDYCVSNYIYKTVGESCWYTIFGLARQDIRWFIARVEMHALKCGCCAN